MGPPGDANVIEELGDLNRAGTLRPGYPAMGRDSTHCRPGCQYMAPRSPGCERSRKGRGATCSFVGRRLFGTIMIYILRNERASRPAHPAFDVHYYASRPGHPAMGHRHLVGRPATEVSRPSDPAVEPTGRDRSAIRCRRDYPAVRRGDWASRPTHPVVNG